jgi:hypothetical protein
MKKLLKCVTVFLLLAVVAVGLHGCGSGNGNETTSLQDEINAPPSRIQGYSNGTPNYSAPELASASNAAERWEYTFVNFRDENASMRYTGDMISDANILGAEGWELVTINSEGWIFKRRLP